MCHVPIGLIGHSLLNVLSAALFSLEPLFFTCFRRSEISAAICSQRLCFFFCSFGVLNIPALTRCFLVLGLALILWIISARLLGVSGSDFVTCCAARLAPILFVNLAASLSQSSTPNEYLVCFLFLLNFFTLSLVCCFFFHLHFQGNFLFHLHFQGNFLFYSFVSSLQAVCCFHGVLASLLNTFSLKLAFFSSSCNPLLSIFLVLLLVLLSVLFLLFSSPLFGELFSLVLT